MGSSSLFGNVTEHTGSWVPEPTTRGTFSLVSSCVITLSLCVWSCVHLNLPEHNGERKHIWRKIGWVVVGSLVPEIVVFTAWYQRHEAKKMLYFMMDQCGQDHPELFFHRLDRWRKRFSSNYRNKATASSDEPPSENSHEKKSTHPASKTTWTLTHGFYAIMGGFAIDGSTAEIPFIPEGRDKLILTKRGIMISLTLGYIDEFSNISVGNIRDKGKSSSVAKCLIAMQTLWFCTQLVGRLAQSLPISLLELNTFAHGICTLFAIYFWWEKPQDIEQPTLLSLNRIQPLCAFLWMHSNVSREQHSHTVEALRWRAPVHTGIDDCLEQPGRKSWAIRSSLASEVNSDSSDSIGNLSLIAGQYASEDISRKQIVPHTGTEPSSPLLRQQSSDIPSNLPRESQSPSTPPGIVLIKRGNRVPGTVFFLANSSSEPESVLVDQIQVNRLTLASKVLVLHPSFFAEAAKTGSLSNSGSNANYLAPRAAEITSTTYSAGIPVIFTTAMVYGGLHCLAWNSQSFASSTERLLWRISCVVLMAPIPLGTVVLATCAIPQILLRVVVGFLPSLASYLKKAFKDDGILTYLGMGALILLLCSFLIFASLTLIFGRAYLLIECFINVGYLNSRVFILPSWTNYLPHIG
ncbi:uncharacterized protein LY89DRAFT_673130 [Mollisia scopiformis]|uniref:Uncharacterized protein n=1 Tax=Mollisia scopiformis TaxID=149040 RepID=A0A194WYK6_MOLSC|nr:uncharacterized protein LY89DRAFT_673130 [Mollisia scopiformis]KUJ13030.1 hypothetical protein LY89DRAFT_673130 [Mollisia scopiformis]